MPNARTSERAPFMAQIDVLAAGATAPRRVWGSDVSEGGIFLQTTHPFRVGDRVSLRFDVDEHEVHVRAAEVMWTRPFEPVTMRGQMPGAGLKFVALDSEDRAALRRFVLPRLAAGSGSSRSDDAHDALAAAPWAAGTADLQPGSMHHLLLDAHDTLEPNPAEVLDDGLRTDPSSPAVDDAPAGLERPAPVSLMPAWSDEGRSSSLAPAPALGIELQFDDDGPHGGSNLGADLRRSAPLRSFDDTVLAALRQDNLLEAPEGVPVDLERGFEEGSVSLQQLPVGDDRESGLGALRANRWLLPISVGLLCAGLGIGVLGGQDLPTDPAHDLIGAASTAAESTTPPAAGAPIAAPADPIAPVHVAEPAPAPVPAPMPAPMEASTPPATATEATAPALASAVERAAPAATTVRAAEAEPVPAVPVHNESAPTLTASRASVERSRHPRAADLEVHEVSVGEARVVRAFTLSEPPRLVVDLRGGALPRTPPAAHGRVERIRLGTPAAQTQRVVFELRDAKPIADLKAKVTGGALRVTFR